MAKFNRAAIKAAARSIMDNDWAAPFSPIKSEVKPSGRTYEGAPGYVRNPKGELFLLAVSNMVGEDTFYESADARDSRYAELIGKVAVADPEWMAGFLRWLRSDANMRSASLVGALATAKALIDAGIPGSRPMVASVLQRADEPGEALAYWMGRYGRAVPKPVKRGVADAAVRLYNEFSLLKYDTATHDYRFADVLDIAHPSAATPQQGDLFRVALERRHGRAELSLANLPMLRANVALRAELADEPSVLLDRDRLQAAGMTWEDALSAAGSTVDKAKLWEAMIPSMGYMALLRNLRNFDEAGVSDVVAERVAARLSDPERVARSRQFPFRFLSAYEQAPSLRWGHALDKALQLSLRNLPALPGRTLVLVDTSGSMTSAGVSARSKVTPAKAAAVFGVALAAKGERVDLHGFASGVFAHQVKRGASVLREIDRFLNRIGEVGHGTEIAGSVRATYDGHDRVVIISDMQTMSGGVSGAVPHDIPLYGFNLGGYRHGAYTAGGLKRHELGGLTDATFRMLPLLEAGGRAEWPWL